MDDAWGAGEAAALRGAGKTAMERAERGYRAIIRRVTNRDDLDTLTREVAAARTAWASIWQELDVLHADTPGPRSRALVADLTRQIKANAASIEEVAARNGMVIRHTGGAEE